MHMTTHPDAVYCPEFGCYVHPDDYTDGINDLENIMRDEARDAGQEAADYWEAVEAAAAWYCSTEFLGAFWYGEAIQDACWEAYWVDGDDVPF